MRLNLLLLMTVSFLPFPTALMAEAIRDPDAERAAVVFYGATLLAITLVFWALWGTVVRDRSLLRPEVSEVEARAILTAATPSVGFYAGVVVLAIVAPQVAAFGYLALAVVSVLRARGDEPAPTEASEPA